MSREAVLPAALTLVDTEGLEALPLRRLGAELGRDPMDLHRLPARQFPHLRATASLLVDYDGAEELDQGITVLLTGLAAQVHPTSTPSTATATAQDTTEAVAGDPAHPDRPDASSTDA